MGVLWRGRPEEHSATFETEVSSHLSWRYRHHWLGSSEMLLAFRIADDYGAIMGWMRNLSGGLLITLTAACASVEQHGVVNRPINAEAFASVGDIVLRVDVQENLPNLFGRADIYGRKRDRGFSEVRFMGLSPNGRSVFRRRDVDIQTNETTMNTMGFGTAVVTAQPSGGGVVGSGVYTQSPAPNVQTLPADTFQFELDLSLSRIITVRDRTIEILDVNASGVRFIVR